jgi:hypothetical protein
MFFVGYCSFLIPLVREMVKPVLFYSWELEAETNKFSALSYIYNFFGWFFARFILSYSYYFSYVLIILGKSWSSLCVFEKTA